MAGMGNAYSGRGSHAPIDPHPILLRPEQSIRLLGFTHAKSTLTWADVIEHPHITFRLCVDQGLKTEELYKMQPSLQEWLRISRCTVKDMEDLALWTPDPFMHFKCTIGDLLLHKKYITAGCMARCRLTVRILRERYGLTADLMCALQYTPKEWTDLQIGLEDLNILTEAQIERIFGTNCRSAVLSRLSPNITFTAPMA